MGSHCGGRVPRHKASGVETPYSPSLTGRLAANGHPTAGASLSQCEKTALLHRFASTLKKLTLIKSFNLNPSVLPFTFPAIPHWR
ncbi:hypothetical protein [Nostoc sp.]|uniref:hypothetical protein n=1 Tax=Nostoc sp. TaxID=1180 RepID=UPI002FF85156